MLGYHLFIAWKSLRRTPGNTLLIVAGIALGVTVATLFSTIRHTFAKDPIPSMSSVLHYVRMDSWDPQKPYPGPGDIPMQITYQDMIGIMKSDIPLRQTGSFRAALRTFPRTRPDQARIARTRVCHADFFAMFNVPFRHGSAWDRGADTRAEPVVVIDEDLNNRWFGGEDSVGQLVSIEGQDFRVVGVLAHWHPAIQFYDLTGHPTNPAESMFIPMSHVRPLEIWSVGFVQSWKPGTGASIESALAGERTFIQMWVELPGPAEVAAYKGFLDAFAMEQRRIGRFQRPLDNRVTPLLERIKERKLPSPEVTAMMIAGNLFLAACALSLMGLLLARFLARSAEIGVRRALGAKRWDIFVQHVIECEVVGLAGGLLGLALASASLRIVNGWYKTMTWFYRDDVLQMDLTMAWFAVAASLAAGLLAGVYPAYRVCRIAPASHLKIQ
jgi:putative ABC transport system permease protein